MSGSAEDWGGRKRGAPPPIEPPKVKAPAGAKNWDGELNPEFKKLKRTINVPTPTNQP